MKREIIKETYSVNGGEVLLTIIIGDAQVGGSAVMLSGTIIGEGNITHLKLGKAEELKDKKIKVKTVVADINDQTNNTSVTYILEGGHSRLEKPVTSQVDNDGDSMVYSATFKMV